MSLSLRMTRQQMRAPSLGALWLCFGILPFPFSCSNQAQSAILQPIKTVPAMTYPKTKRSDLVEEHFGQKVADPYRWLENDPRTDKQVADWIGAQNHLTTEYLDTLPGREVFRKSLASLYNYESVTAPYKRGSQYFYTRKSGQENQPSLYSREGVNGQERLLINPNHWSTDGANALSEWAVSDDGTRIAYAVQEGGSDWRTIKVLDVATGKDLQDQVTRARFTNIAWIKDGAGFFYSRYPQPKPGDSTQASLVGHAVYFHRIDTPQSQDRLLYATPDHPQRLNVAQVTDDGRYAVILSSANMSTSAMTVVDLTSADWKPRTLIDDLDNSTVVVANIGTRLFLVTDKHAKHSKLVTYDLAEANPTFKDFVPEQRAILNDAHLVGDYFLVSYLVDAKMEIARYRLDGTPDGMLKLPGIGSVHDLRGNPKDSEAFFTFNSFNVPGTVYRYDAAAGTMTAWIEPNMQADLAHVLVDQVFYTSKDGTQVPMFLIRRKDVTRPAPTLLYGYGGYGISLMPSYVPFVLAWVEQGGIVAIPNIRGGAEYGAAWHQAGMRLKKQNVFDDFIAAAEFLKVNRIAPADGIAVHGESNGGLLVGAVVNQRPDLFAAALPAVGVMDMLRFNTFTGGQLWVGEFGDPARQADFQNLFAYSPYHNIHPGKNYPAILATTADADDRVVPGHTFKYVAALQAAAIGNKPHLVRIDTRAGHGAGKPTDKVIADTSDMWAFAAYWTGLNVAPN